MAGTCFHEIFEHIDFQSQDTTALATLVAETLTTYGYVVTTWHQTVCAAVQAVLETPLTHATPTLTLRQVAVRHRLNELEFYLPVAPLVEADHAAAVTRNALAEVLLRFPSPAMPRDYGHTVARLPFEPLRGFLKGNIDMVFVDEGIWYLIDYKTNYLGNDVQDYAEDRLPAHMAQHHYYLQYHFYSVAVHRYLQRRLTDYDYDRHFGGVLYLFVRGMSPDTGAGYGVFHERPPRARIEALSTLLANPGATRRSQ